MKQNKKKKKKKKKTTTKQSRHPIHIKIGHSLISKLTFILTRKMKKINEKKRKLMKKLRKCYNYYTWDIVWLVSYTFNVVKVKRQVTSSLFPSEVYFALYIMISEIWSDWLVIRITKWRDKRPAPCSQKDEHFALYIMIPEIWSDWIVICITKWRDRWPTPCSPSGAFCTLHYDTGDMVWLVSYMYN